MTDLTCVLCNTTDRYVRVALCAWKEADDMPRFTAEPRCPDSESCRQRLAARGETWPLTERGA